MRTPTAQKRFLAREPAVADSALPLRVLPGARSDSDRPPAPAVWEPPTVRILTTVGEWEVLLTSEAVLRIWADGYQEIDGHYDFGILIDAGDDLPDTALVTNRTPADPRRIVVSVARVPVVAVKSISGG